MEDLDLTKEFWRFSDEANASTPTIPAPQDKKDVTGHDPDVVEVVLDGSDTPAAAETLKTAPKLKQKKRDKKTSSLHSDEKKSQQKDSKDDKPHSTLLTPPEKPSFEEQNPPASKPATPPAVNKEQAAFPAASVPAVGPVTPSDPSSKPRSKQKNFHSRKDAPSDKSASKTSPGSATPEHVAVGVVCNDAKPHSDSLQENTAEGAKPASTVQSSVNANQSAGKATSVVPANPPEEGSARDSQSQAAKENERQNVSLQHRAAVSNEATGADKAKVKVVLMQKPAEAVAKVTPTKTIVKERKNTAGVRGKAVKVKTSKGKADGASQVGILPPVDSKVRLVKSKPVLASTVVDAQEETSTGSKSGTLVRSVNVVGAPSQGNVAEQVPRRGESSKLKSSADRSAPSFAAERKRKKRKHLDEEPIPTGGGRAAGAVSNTNNNLNGMGMDTGVLGGRLRNRESENAMFPAQGKASTLASPRSVPSPDSKPRGAVGHDTEKIQVRVTTRFDANTANSDVANVAKALRGQIKEINVSETPNQGQKRGHSEQLHTGASGARGGDETESVAKRLRSQSYIPSEMVGNSMQKGKVHNDVSCDASKIRSIVLEAIAPSYSVIESVKNDVHRLVSMLLSLKQENEFYKDVVHRSVVDEGGNLRTSIQELRSEMLQAVKEHARETERRLTGTIERLFKDKLRGESNLNGHVSGGHQHYSQIAPAVQTPIQGETRPESIPPLQEYPEGDPNAMVPNSESQSNLANLPVRVVNGGNTSPTAIANVNQTETPGVCVINGDTGDPPKEAEGSTVISPLGSRVSHLVARQITVWLLETPHEYTPQSGVSSVLDWARETASAAFIKVAENLTRFSSYMQAYQTLCSSLGNDAVELQWFVSPGDIGHLHRARRNYAAWDPPPTDDEWNAEVTLLREMSERFRWALTHCNLKDMADMQACVAVANAAAAGEGNSIAALNRYQMMNGVQEANQPDQ